ncbi:MAG: hypothetical protein Q4Q58_06855 [Thermoplasmata archaeon]|nr:hypothetical protein [Thermoplasmata archaeon]
MTVYEREDTVTRIIRTSKGKSKRYLSDEQLEGLRKGIFELLGKGDEYFPRVRETEPKRQRPTCERPERARLRGNVR